MDKIRMEYVTLEDCHTARGLLVAVDVVRAFTTAAFAFAAGVRRILLAGTVEEAMALRGRYPGTLVMGEVGGLPVPGFDLWNSPAQFEGLDLSGQVLIQRTSSGTQGIVRSSAAGPLFAASFVVAGATVRAIQRLKPDRVTFVLTGIRPNNPHSGREDLACAKYMAALLRGQQPDRDAHLSWAVDFLPAHPAGVPDDLLDQFSGDLELCTQIDRFSFSMPVERVEDGLLVMESSTYDSD